MNQLNFQLTFDSVKDVDGYNIVLEEESSGRTIHNYDFQNNERIPKLATVFPGLSPGTSYIAKISTETVDFNGQKSRSEPISHAIQTIGVSTDETRLD